MVVFYHCINKLKVKISIYNFKKIKKEVFFYFLFYLLNFQKIHLCGNSLNTS